MSGKLVSQARKTTFNHAAAKTVLVYLADRFNDETGECFPLISTMSRETDFSEREIRRVLQVFVAIDLITQTPREIKFAPGNKPDRRRHAYDFAFNLALFGTDLSERFAAKFREAQGKKVLHKHVSETPLLAEDRCLRDSRNSQTGVSETSPPLKKCLRDMFPDPHIRKEPYLTTEPYKPEQTRARPPRAVEKPLPPPRKHPQAYPPQVGYVPPRYIPDPEHLPGDIDELYQRCRLAMQGHTKVTLSELSQATEALAAWKQQQEIENAGREISQHVNRCREGASAWTQKSNFGANKKPATAAR